DAVEKRRHDHDRRQLPLTRFELAVLELIIPSLASLDKLVGQGLEVRPLQRRILISRSEPEAERVVAVRKGCDGAIKQDGLGVDRDPPLILRELVEVDLARRESERQRELEVADDAARIGDVLLVGYWVEREGDDRPALRHVLFETLLGRLFGVW